LNKQLKAKPGDPDLLVQRGEAYLSVTIMGIDEENKCDFVRAAADFTAASTADPTSFKAWRGRAASMDLSGLQGDALHQALLTQMDYVGKALAINPKDGATLLLRGEAEWQLGAEDTSAVQRAQAKGPPTPNELKYFSAALADASLALTANPSVADAWILKGEAQSELGDPNSALDSYLHAMNVDAISGLGAATDRIQVLMAGDNPKEALVYIDRLLPYMPTSGIAGAYATRAQADVLLGDFQVAVTDAGQAIARGGDDATTNARFYALRSAIYAQQRDFVHAILDEQQAVKLVPNSLEMWRNLGALQLNEEDYAGALESFKKVIEIDPADNDTRMITALLYAGADDWPNASAQYAIALPNASVAEMQQEVKDLNQNAVANPNNTTIPKAAAMVQAALDAANANAKPAA